MRKMRTRAIENINFFGIAVGPRLVKAPNTLPSGMEKIRGRYVVLGR
jgi:hypothetical protein